MNKAAFIVAKSPSGFKRPGSRTAEDVNEAAFVCKTPRGNRRAASSF